jgi:hypothetical protein
MIDNCSSNFTKQLHEVLFDFLARLVAYDVMMDYSCSYTFCINLSYRFEGLKHDIQGGNN